MWFLDAETAVRLLLACTLWTVFVIVKQKYRPNTRLSRYLVLLDIVVTAFVSVGLCIFYLCYTLITWGFTQALFSMQEKKLNRKKLRTFFVVSSLLCCVPFFYLRSCEMFRSLPLIFELTGIAYNMLKAVDAIYYTYYAEERIDLVTYSNYMLFFPVITAGPIMRYRDFAVQMNTPSDVTGDSLVKNIKRLIRGYFKKVVVLAFVSMLLTRLADMDGHFYVSLAVCAVSYLLLWLDMSGYADIAIAMSGCMGVTVAENFKHPLKAASFTQFWRNWHVSLTDWIREHVFVTLNGKRLSKKQGALIGFGTMMVMAFWHGATAVYLADGLFNGIILAAENLLSLTTVNKRKVSKGYYFVRCLIVAALFAFDTIFYTLTPDRLANVLHGFIRL